MKYKAAYYTDVGIKKKNKFQKRRETLLVPISLGFFVKNRNEDNYVHTGRKQI